MFIHFIQSIAYYKQAAAQRNGSSFSWAYFCGPFRCATDRGITFTIFFNDILKYWKIVVLSCFVLLQHQTLFEIIVLCPNYLLNKISAELNNFNIYIYFNRKSKHVVSMQLRTHTYVTMQNSKRQPLEMQFVLNIRVFFAISYESVETYNNSGSYVIHQGYPKLFSLRATLTPPLKSQGPRPS